MCKDGVVVDFIAIVDVVDAVDVVDVVDVVDDDVHDVEDAEDVEDVNDVEDVEIDEDELEICNVDEVVALVEIDDEFEFKIDVNEAMIAFMSIKSST